MRSRSPRTASLVDGQPAAAAGRNALPGALSFEALGYPVVVFGGKHADVPITVEIGGALGRLIASAALACVIDLSELGSNAARRRFMAAFSEALYEANEEPLHLVLDKADLWAPQRPIKGWESLLGHIGGNCSPRPRTRLHPVAHHATPGRRAQGCAVTGR